MLAGVGVTLQRWPIIGRRPELEVFERALGSGVLAGVVIYGRAGVGKTRLADECRRQAAAAGHPTERVAGSRTTALVPLGAVVRLPATRSVGCPAAAACCRHSSASRVFPTPARP